MPKNYGAGVDVVSSQSRRLHDLVQLVRQDLWLRMDRNMIDNAAGGRVGRKATNTVAAPLGVGRAPGAAPSYVKSREPAKGREVAADAVVGRDSAVRGVGRGLDVARKPGGAGAPSPAPARPDVARRD